MAEIINQFKEEKKNEQYGEEKNIIKIKEQEKKNFLEENMMIFNDKSIKKKLNNRKNKIKIKKNEKEEKKESKVKIDNDDKNIENLDIEVKDYDPIISLDGGDDGLIFYRNIASNAKQHLSAKGKVLLEVGIGQANIVKKMLEENGFVCYIKKDYNNIDRIVVGEIL